jgi:predicted nucleic acid-binding protein
MPGYVIDASVLVEIFVSGPEHEACLSVLEHAAESNIELYAPDAIYYEVAGALRRYEIRENYVGMGEDISNLSDLDLITTATRELLLPAVEIARRYVIGIYDSFYLALSNRLSVPLITVDKRLVNAVENKPFEVIYARDLSV